jgi:hypothetical protein
MIKNIRFILGLPFIIVAYICFIPLYIFSTIGCLIYGNDYPFIKSNIKKNK